MEHKKFRAIKNIDEIKIGDIIEVVGVRIGLSSNNYSEHKYYAYNFIKPKIDFIKYFMEINYVNNKDYFVNIIEERDKKLNEILNEGYLCK